MLAPEFRQDPTRISRVVANAQFRRHRQHVLAFLAGSRVARADGEQLLNLQTEMARELIDLQASRKEYRRNLEAQGTPDRDLETAADVCAGLAYLIKQIADGIAWRSLRYDRGAIRELAAAPQTGSMEMQAALSEVTVAGVRLAETGGLLILNDLTNFLRYGDLTTVSPDGVFIEEVKSGAASRRSRRARRQRRRIQEVTDFINRRERVSEHGKQRLVQISAIPRTHVPELEPLFSDARSVGSAHARLSDAIAVELFAVELLAEGGRFTIHNPFSQAGQATLSHSLEVFGRFAPNLAPYSIFPLQDADCVALMSGEIWLSTYFNIGNLVRSFRRRGLWVRLPSKDEIKRLPQNLRPGEVASHEFDHPIVVGAADKMVHLSFAQLARIEMELLNEESFVDAIEEMLSFPIEKALLYWSFRDEHILWD